MPQFFPHESRRRSAKRAAAAAARRSRRQASPLRRRQASIEADSAPAWPRWRRPRPAEHGAVNLRLPSQHLRAGRQKPYARLLLKAQAGDVRGHRAPRRRDERERQLQPGAKPLAHSTSPVAGSALRHTPAIRRGGLQFKFKLWNRSFLWIVTRARIREFREKSNGSVSILAFSDTQCLNPEEITTSFPQGPSQGLGLG